MENALQGLWSILSCNSVLWLVTKSTPIEQKQEEHYNELQQIL
ncbi:MAG: hypothetical protein IJO51_01760 [Clostridia bacterium]|nr:hypothetical protein [Clostridia bacterium]